MKLLIFINGAFRVASVNERPVRCPFIAREEKCLLESCPACQELAAYERMQRSLLASDQDWQGGLITTEERNNYIFSLIAQHSEPMDIRSIVGFTSSRRHVQ